MDEETKCRFELIDDLADNFGVRKLSLGEFSGKTVVGATSTISAILKPLAFRGDLDKKSLSLV